MRIPVAVVGGIDRSGACSAGALSPVKAAARFMFWSGIRQRKSGRSDALLRSTPFWKSVLSFAGFDVLASLGHPLARSGGRQGGTGPARLANPGPRVRAVP